MRAREDPATVAPVGQDTEDPEAQITLAQAVRDIQVQEALLTVAPEDPPIAVPEVPAMPVLGGLAMPDREVVIPVPPFVDRPSPTMMPLSVRKQRGQTSS